MARSRIRREKTKPKRKKPKARTKEETSNDGSVPSPESFFGTRNVELHCLIEQMRRKPAGLF